MSYPTSLDDLSASRGTSGAPLSNPNHITHHTNEDTAIQALETKVGIDGSADTSSIDYKLKNTSSVDPGHKHTNASVTLALDDLSDVVISSPTNGNGLTFNGTNWVNSTTSTADASTTVKGVTKLSVAPVLSTSPIAVGDNDPRFTTSTGTTISSSDKIVDQLGFQKGTEIYAADSVGTDSYAITLSPAPASYVTGMTYRFKAGTANTGACTLNVNSLGAKTIKKRLSTDLTTGDILTNQIVEVTYDGTNFQMMSPQSQQFLGVFASGITTYNIATASGTQNIPHGLGVAPVSFDLNILYAFNATSIGLSQSFNGNTISLYTYPGGTTGQTTTGIELHAGTSGDIANGTITADATNIIISWTRTGSPTGTAQIIWKAFA